MERKLLEPICAVSGHHILWSLEDTGQLLQSLEVVSLCEARTEDGKWHRICDLTEAIDVPLIVVIKDAVAGKLGSIARFKGTKGLRQFAIKQEAAQAHYSKTR